MPLAAIITQRAWNARFATSHARSLCVVRLSYAGCKVATCFRFFEASAGTSHFLRSAFSSRTQCANHAMVEHRVYRMRRLRRGLSTKRMHCEFSVATRRQATQILDKAADVPMFGNDPIAAPANRSRCSRVSSSVRGVNDYVAVPTQPSCSHECAQSSDRARTTSCDARARTVRSELISRAQCARCAMDQHRVYRVRCVRRGLSAKRSVNHLSPSRDKRPKSG
jgi:hypothetical protein